MTDARMLRPPSAWPGATTDGWPAMDDDKEQRVTPQQIAALGLGLSVTIASSVLTSLVTPVLFPFNFLISLGLGAAAGYGALKVLDPRTRQDLLDSWAEVRYHQMLREISEYAARTAEASQRLSGMSPQVSGKLGEIARMTEMIHDRYEARGRDFTGVSATYLILKRFEEIVAHYLKVKCGELFLDEDQSEEEIAETELYVIPMTETALGNLGKKLDAGEAIEKGVSKGTLESMLRSLNLIESLGD